MTKEEINVRLVKAATMGYAQSLLNRGFAADAILPAMEAYTNPHTGMLQKRASDRIEAVKAVMYKAIMGN